MSILLASYLGSIIDSVLNRDLLRETVVRPLLPSLHREDLIEELNQAFASRAHCGNTAVPTFSFGDLHTIANRIYHRTLTAGAILHARGEIPYDPTTYGFAKADNERLDAELCSIMDRDSEMAPPDSERIPHPPSDNLPVGPYDEVVGDDSLDPSSLGIVLENMPSDENGQPMDEETWEPLPEMSPPIAPNTGPDWEGDTMMTNNLLLMRDLFIHVELCTAVKEGDIGRVFEMIKVRPIASSAALD